MLSDEQKSRISKLVNQYCNQYGYPVLPIKFELNGVTAGTFNYNGNTPLHFNFNQILAANNYAEFLNRTVPHECAHYIDFMNNGSKQRTFKDGRRNMHGTYFKKIMKEISGNLEIDTTTYHTYDTSHVARRKQRRWEYKCSCFTWKLSTVMHNRVQKGEARRCNKDCKEQITKENWTGKEIK